MSEAGTIALAGARPHPFPVGVRSLEGLAAPIDFCPGRLGGEMEELPHA